MPTVHETNPKKLGFGLMRLPRKGLFIDVEQVKTMVDLFMEAGFTYLTRRFCIRDRKPPFARRWWNATRAIPLHWRQS